MKRRLVSMAVFMVILVIPAFIAGYRLWRFYRDLGLEQAAAEAELQKAAPRPGAHGSLGAIYMNQGRVADALPLLQTASDLELKSKFSVHDTLTLAKAQILGSQKGLPGSLSVTAQANLRRSLQLAEAFAPGRKAAAYSTAAELYGLLGDKKAALAAWQRAVALQPDDWVDEGQGVRYKVAGLSGYYQKMLAAAQLP
jgi:tetratricopeptide (TPR) repeat protein